MKYVSILCNILEPIMFSLVPPDLLLFMSLFYYTLLLWGAYSLHEKSSCDRVGCSAFTYFSQFHAHTAPFCNVLPISFKLLTGTINFTGLSFSISDIKYLK
jgi:hypothetical protein